MAAEYCAVAGELVSAADLRVPKARDLAHRLAAAQVDFARLVECRKTEGSESVLFDLDVEVSQSPKHDIRPTERVAVTFAADDVTIPKTEALRTDFPQVPHLNLQRQEFPRDLCIYADPYERVRLGWTAARFLERIREWLALTARGELHQPDQPLEPLLVDYFGHILLPHDLSTETPDHLFVTRWPAADEFKPFFCATRSRPNEATPLEALFTVYRGKPQKHGTIHRYPSSLADVAEMAKSSGLDLVADLRAALPKWKADEPTYLGKRLILALTLPKTRAEGGVVESVDCWCFLVIIPIKEIGKRLGVWREIGGTLGLLIPPDTTGQGDDVNLAPLNPCWEMTPTRAAEMSDAPASSDDSFVAVGVGALGSQVVMNAARGGFGRWSLVDEDVLMPHNLVRHALDGNYVGSDKVSAVAYSANSIVGGPARFTGLRGTVSSRGHRTGPIAEALAAASVIVDMSASVEVARALAIEVKSAARRASLFLSPSGRDLVLLAEDRARGCTLDNLEMQYYRAIVSDARLDGHLAVPGRRRYGNSCRDLAFLMPQSRVGLHASIGSTSIQTLARSEAAAIIVWRSTDAGEVQRLDLVAAATTTMRVGAWTVILDAGLLDALEASRIRKLPKETGGSLLGSFDTERRRLYVAGTLPSPSDSQEWTVGYVRGREGLEEEVKRVKDVTYGMLEYIGEWHSHPDGCAALPSSTDFELFGWLTTVMSREGLPATMLVVGGASVTCCVGEVNPDYATIARREEFGGLA